MLEAERHRELTPDDTKSDPAGPDRPGAKPPKNGAGARPTTESSRCGSAFGVRTSLFPDPAKPGPGLPLEALQGLRGGLGGTSG